MTSALQTKLTKEAFSYLEEELIPELEGAGHAALAHKISHQITGKGLVGIGELSEREKDIVWEKVEAYTKHAVQTGRSNPISPMGMAELVTALGEVQSELQQTKKHEIRSGAYFPSR